MINHILGFYLSKSLLICVDNMESKKQRKSGYNFEELLNKEWSILTKAEYSELQAAFKKTDQRNGGITFYDLVNIIRSKLSFTQLLESLSLNNAKIKLTKTSPIKKYAYLLSNFCSTRPPPSKKKEMKTTREIFLRKTSIVIV